MTRPPLVTMETDMLHAYVDDQLDAAERAAVEAYLGDHPEAADEVANWRRQNEALTALFPVAANETMPPQLWPRHLATEIAASRREHFRNLAAAIVLLLLGSGVGWFGRDYLTPTEAASDRLIDQAVAAHNLYVREKTHAVEATADAPNLMTWLSNRIATPIDAPDLADQGFRFVGGRLLPGDPKAGVPVPAAQLMYENGSAQRLTLYVTGPLPDRKEVWDLETRGGVEAYYWASAAVTCTVVGDVSPAEMRTVGKAVFEQLTRRPDSAWTRGH